MFTPFTSTLAPAAAALSPILSKTTSATFTSLVAGLMNVINLLVWLMGGVAIVVFFYGVAQFVRKSGDTHAHSQGYKLMQWGIIALFIFFSLGGILNFFCGSLFAQSGGCPNS
ncbi:MAG: hypothetical protein WCI89_02315 [bacterium]